MKSLNEIIKEIKVICDKYPVIEDRITALRQAGYNAIDFKYLKQTKIILYGNSAGLLSTVELTRKKVYRIQVSQENLKKVITQHGVLMYQWMVLNANKNSLSKTKNYSKNN